MSATVFRQFSNSIPLVGSVCHEDDCDLDADDVDQNEKAFEFITILHFAALLPEDSNESVYILKVEEKGIAEKEEIHGYGHSISAGAYFLRKKYFKMRKSRSTRYHKFSILSGNALVHWKCLKSLLIFRTI